MKKGRNVSMRERLLRVGVYLDELDALLFDVQTIFKCVFILYPSLVVFIYCSYRFDVHGSDQK
jgi:hypothetical protein